MPSSQNKNNNIHKYLRTTRLIKADESGGLPTDIEILRTGMWETPWHGDFMITLQDLSEYVQNFQANIRPNSTTVGLPIDIDHDAGAAAGWMKNLYVQPNTDGGMSLWASVEWTSLGVQVLTDKMYTMFSPEFCPEGYYDPEGNDDPCDNVLVGGGLTNRPLFKDLQPIVASEDGGKPTAGEFKKIFLSASIKENEVPTLEETRTKDGASLSDEEKRLLADNKDQLTAEEQVKFGLTAAPTNPVDPTPPATPEEPVAASEKGEKVIITAAEKAKLEADAAKGVQAHETLQKIQAADHVKGLAFNERNGFKVKADMQEKLVDFYVSASDDQKAVMDSVLENAKPIVAASDMSANGSNEDAASEGNAKALQEKAEEIVKASEGKKSFTEALLEASDKNPELTKNREAELVPVERK